MFSWVGPNVPLAFSWLFVGTSLRHGIVKCSSGQLGHTRGVVYMSLKLGNGLEQRQLVHLLESSKTLGGRSYTVSWLPEDLTRFWGDGHNRRVCPVGSCYSRYEVGYSRTVLSSTNTMLVWHTWVPVYKLLEWWQVCTGVGIIETWFQYLPCALHLVRAGWGWSVYQQLGINRERPWRLNRLYRKRQWRLGPQGSLRKPTLIRDCKYTRYLAVAHFNPGRRGGREVSLISTSTDSCFESTRGCEHLDYQNRGIFDFLRKTFR